MASGGSGHSKRSISSDPPEQKKGLPIRLVALKSGGHIDLLSKHSHSTDSVKDHVEGGVKKKRNVDKKSENDWRKEPARVKGNNWRKDAPKNKDSLNNRARFDMRNKNASPDRTRSWKNPQNQAGGGEFSEMNEYARWSSQNDRRGHHSTNENGFGGARKQGQRIFDDSHQNRSGQGNRERQGTDIPGPPSHDNKVRLPGYKKLEEWSHMDPVEIVTIVANTRAGFFDLLKGDLRPDLMVLVIRVLAKVCQVDFKGNKVQILAGSCNQIFLQNLTICINKIPSETNAAKIAGIPSFFQDLLVFCETVIDLLPNTACEHLGPTLMCVKVAVVTVSTYRRITFPESVTNRLTELEGWLHKLLEERERKPVKESSKNETLKHQPPPDNFRELSIFPLPEDILTHHKAFVRPNIVEGAYDSVEHYLDVQFRLLREDFVWPLRDGITNYMRQLAAPEKKPNQRSDNIKIYHNVRFLEPYVDKNRVGYIICFQQKKMGRVNWEHSKRLMFGALLVFTSDNFATITFGTVLDRKLEQLRNGKLAVELSFNNEIPELFNCEFTMVESEIYFEPYYHVLKALQVMKGTEFPMSRYIVDVQSTTNPPQYIVDAPQYTFKIEGFRVPVLVREIWPSAQQLYLDDSQYMAFQSALSKEFVVIQGPPGTGKTYLGLKIARTIIQNIRTIINASPNPHIDNSDDDDDDVVVDELGYFLPGDERVDLGGVGARGDPQHTPLLVVCFTNHALDQFLEGLLPTTNNMVRIGGQSRSDVLKEYNLREKRYKSRGMKSRDLTWLSRNIRDRMSYLLADIKGMQKDIERLNTNYGIVSIHSIQQIYQHQNINCFVEDNAKLSNDLFLEWLIDDEEFYNTEEAYAELVQDGAEEAAAHQEVLRPDELDEWQQLVDVDLDIEQLPANFKLAFALQLPCTSDTEFVNDLRKRIGHLKGSKDPDRDMKIWLLETKLRKGRYICNQLRKVRQQDVTIATTVMEQNVYFWRLSRDQRWAMYQAWVVRLRAVLLTELQVAEAKYRMEAASLEETQLMDDLKLLRKADVIGMTTTGAARLQPLLQALKCRVVIVEEAAEVMESHIIVSLTNHCQHLILIGDHQQLRPTTAVFKLARDFNFDISLFERMLRNGLHCEVLKVQHRMRPEIAQLIVPSIYKELYNHESVMHFNPVPGVRKSIFFITHNHREEEIGETHSRRNAFEADFLLRFCRYLLLQGYAPERITILATYSGQMFYLRTKRKESPALDKVQITIVDNFQGEENDIILLSLVRNNEVNNVGFLKTENRVCVALSRAKHGLYIMGNMSNLTHGGGLWCNIKDVLEEQKALGESLPLYCVVHENQWTDVSSPDDFDKVPEGGCMLPCEANLVCGHICVRLCHAEDREHTKYQCRKACPRTPPNCGLLHPCPKLCFHPCGDCMTMVERGLPCGHSVVLPCHVDYTKHDCLAMVEVTSEDCGHTFNKHCFQGPDLYCCTIPCDIRLDCGHTCVKQCHVKDDPNHDEYKCKKPCPHKNVNCTQDHICARRCYEECGLCCVKVQKKAPTCDHVYTVDCSLPPESIKCEEKCTKELPCGHPCPLKCFEKCGQCKKKVRKPVTECGHKVLIECSTVPQRRHCQGPCQRKMTCGHRCNRTCKVICSSSDSCTELVPTHTTPACGHTFQMPCNLAAQGLPADSSRLLVHCTQPCKAQLECGHLCEGTCGRCLQGRIHRECQAKCGRNLICGHSCNVPCARTCPPCRQKCRMRCVHNRCNNTCGVPCTKCQEICEWRCPHKRCTRRCWELCNREPCTEACAETLKCGHPCIGFCGEMCPPLCRICDREMVETIVFGSEDEPDARFVYLVDCKHIIESGALETWLTQQRKEVSMPQCPLCKTDIMKTMRYMNRIKLALKDIQGVKRKIFGELNALENRRYQLLGNLHRLKPAEPIRQYHPRHLPRPPHQPSEPTIPLTPFGMQLYNKLQGLLQVEKRGHQRTPRYNLSSVDLQSAALQLEIFQEVAKYYKEVYATVTTSKSTLKTLDERADLILRFLFDSERVNVQEVADINLELRRFKRIAQFCHLEVKANQHMSNELVKVQYNACRSIALSINKYSDDQDRTLEENLRKLANAVDADVKILTNQERREIVAAIGLKQGHWFKCPNGHFYAIGDCGGAMVEATCPECKARIGGTNHQLLANNRLATEMDGATHSAWPGTAMNYGAF